MSKPKSFAKLDCYDYELELTNNLVTGIRIFVESNNDIDVADIASEITDKDGNIYIERHYLKFNSMHVMNNAVRTWVHILVTEI